MRVLYAPQFNDIQKLEYRFEGDVITVTLDGQTDVFDFTGMEDGIASNEGREQAITTTLPINPFIYAEKANGVLSVKLLKFIGMNPTHEENFPDWIEV